MSKHDRLAGLDAWAIRTLYCCLAVSLVSAGLWWNQRRLEAQAPRLVLDPPALDLGEMESTNETEGFFRIKIAGIGDLEVTAVKTSCNCLVANRNHFQIAGNGVETVKYKFLTRGKRGKVKATISIESNDPVRPKSFLSIVARVRDDYFVLPETLDFGRVPWNEERKAMVRVFAPLESEAFPSDIRFTSDLFKSGAITPPDDPKQAWKIEV